MLGIFPVFNNIFTANIYIGNMGEEEGIYPSCRGAHPCWASILFQKKSKQEGGSGGGVEDILFWKSPGVFRFSLHLWKFQTKRGFTPRNWIKLCVLHSTEILRPKTNTPEYSTWFFLDHPRKLNVAFNWPPGKSIYYFFNNPGDSIFATPSLFFFGIVQCICMDLPKTDDNDRAHKNDANNLDIWPMFLSGQVLHTSNSSHLPCNLKKILC